MNINLKPLNETQEKALEQLLDGAEPQQIIWLSGYFQGLSSGKTLNGTSRDVALQNGADHSVKSLKHTILFGSHTGRSEGLANTLKEKLAAKSILADVFAMEEYNVRNLEKEQNLLIIVSTHGEGEPPEMAEDFHRYVIGKRLPKLPNLHFSVLALGDKSYKLFCQTGLEIHQAFKNAGSQELSPLVTCDVDYEEDASSWMDAVINKLAEQSPASMLIPVNGNKVEANVYTKKNPFRATVLEKAKITGRDSDKEVYHVELSINGSGISYHPGDSLGILADNPPALVQNILQKLGMDENETVKLKNVEYSLKNALSHHLEITILTRDVIKNYAKKTGLEGVNEILNNDELLDTYLWGHDILDLINEFEYKLSAQELVDMLRPFPPRLYSISSSQEMVGDEVHITVSTVRYKNKGRERHGAASTYLADRIEVDQQVPVYIERNPAFKLPENEETPIIMVGAGTGIAPYRAFLQHREAANFKGKSWLFFGDRRFYSDFLYQVEWQKYLKKGFLEKIDLAFSRDQETKYYVQHRLAEQQAEIFKWLENGASFYLCGDMKYMAKDVNKTLLEIIKVQGGMTEEEAKIYLKKLKKDKRFQEDVY